VLGPVGLLATLCAGLVSLAGCGDDTTSGAGGQGGATTTTNSGGAPDGGGGSGGTGGGNPDCHPSVLGVGVALPETCDGVFVDADAAPGGDGSRGTPFQTLSDAVAAASASQAVYVCNAASSLDESVTVTVSTTIYAGLDCTSWAATDTKTSLNGVPDQPALSITGDVTVTVEDMIVTGASASSTNKGGNSTAVLIDGAAVTLTRLDLVAGDGADGEDGKKSTGGVTTGTPGNPPTVTGCANTTPVPGGAAVATTCGLESSTSGDGGKGTNAGGVGSNGTQGVADPDVGADNHGNGQTSSVPCTSGSQGAPGANGDPGAGASATDWGALTGGALVNAAGEDGLSEGHPGQGGGGGGGARGATQCGNVTFTGNAGGSGGSGGCGGHPSSAGKGAGSSIGISQSGGALTLDTVTITLGIGGIGGAGADGQPGGGGGAFGAAGGAGACDGGQGGTGGFGGASGGGRGGHALGIVVSGATAPNSSLFDVMGGMKGSGGAAASIGTNGGADGDVCKVLDIDNGSCL